MYFVNTYKVFFKYSDEIHNPNIYISPYISFFNDHLMLEFNEYLLQYVNNLTEYTGLCLKTSFTLYFCLKHISMNPSLFFFFWNILLLCKVYLLSYFKKNFQICITIYHYPPIKSVTISDTQYHLFYGKKSRNKQLLKLICKIVKSK